MSAIFITHGEKHRWAMTVVKGFFKNWSMKYKCTMKESMEAKQQFTVNDADDGEETEDEALLQAEHPKTEIMFCDCTSFLDRFNTSLFILSTCHPAGGIPLWILQNS